MSAVLRSVYLRPLASNEQDTLQDLDEIGTKSYLLARCSIACLDLVKSDLQCLSCSLLIRWLGLLDLGNLSKLVLLSHKQGLVFCCYTQAVNK